MQEYGERNSYNYIDGFGAADDYGDSHLYEGGADDLPFNAPPSPFNPQGHYIPPKPAQQPTSHAHSHCPSVASAHHQASQQPLPQSSTLEGTTLDLPNQNLAHHSLRTPSHANSQHSIHPPSPPSQQASLQPPPTSHQSSVQPHLPPSRQGSVQPSTQSHQGSVNPPSHVYNPMDQYEPQVEVSIYGQQGPAQPHLPPSHQGSVQPSTQSRQGSVNPLSHAYNSMDQYEPQVEVSIYGQQGPVGEEEPWHRVSKKRPHANIVQLSGNQGNQRPDEDQQPRLRQRLRQRAQQVPQTPIRPPQGIFAGPSTGTRSQTRQARPTIVMTNATPAPGARSNGHDVALDEDTEIREGTFLRLTNKRPRPFL
jgi:hypothetical protein